MFHFADDFMQKNSSNLVVAALEKTNHQPLIKMVTLEMQ
jgi:hypothetical protein